MTPSSRINNRYRLVMSLSNINSDFLQLILCMYVSHALIHKPWFGAVLFIFMTVWLLYFQAGLQKLRSKTQNRMLMWTLLAASLVIGLGVTFFYPTLTRQTSANIVSFFVGMVGVRTYLTFKINALYSKRKRSHRWYKILFQSIFLIPCVFYAVWFFQGIDVYFIVTGFLVTGVLMSFQRSTLANFNKYLHNINEDKLEQIFAYRMFSNMSLYSNIALSLGVLTFVCYVSLTQASFNYMTYLVMALWLFILLLSSQLFTMFVRRQGVVAGINVFIIGAVFWIIGSVKMFTVNQITGFGVWTLFWAFGLACINASLNNLNLDFKMVARIANQRVYDKDLQYRSLFMQIVGIIAASCIVLVVLALWEWIVPTSYDKELPHLLRNAIIQLPALFMLVSVLFALKQPLDKRSREKLVNYYKGTNQNLHTQANLNKKLVVKSSVKYGIKIIALLVKPFLRLRVLGKRNMDASGYPSIFVCNHGIFYGPIAAVIYLPTYFRPWVDKKMVDLELCTKEAYQRWLYALPIPDRMKWSLARLGARIATWAINAFNPVPVERDNLRKVMATFDDTVNALKEGDNVLIFPERPRRVTKNGKTFLLHETDSVGSLFTGFASIGNMYYQATGKTLRFYPVYANKLGHTFKIGRPVDFNPDIEAREERQRIAEYLREQMLLLKGDEGYDAKELRIRRKAERKELRKLRNKTLKELKGKCIADAAATTTEEVHIFDISGSTAAEIRSKYRTEIKRIRFERKKMRRVLREDRKKARLDRKALMMSEKMLDHTPIQ